MLLLTYTWCVSFLFCVGFFPFFFFFFSQCHRAYNAPQVYHGAWNQFDPLSPRSSQGRRTINQTGRIQTCSGGPRGPAGQNKTPVFSCLIVCMCATGPDLSMRKAPACYNWFPGVKHGVQPTERRQLLFFSTRCFLPCLSCSLPLLRALFG